MASTTVLSDDFDSKVTDGVQTITYAYKGKAYEIDLGPENQAAADELFGEYIAVSRPISSTTASGAKRARSLTRSSNSDSAKIREWAVANGFPDLSARGRISSEVREAYEKAHPASAT